MPESALLRRLGWRLVPLLTIIYLIAYIDRANVSYAKLTMVKALGMTDSGFRGGTDILKALGLGARFVFIGRPFNYAAALAGEAGVDHAIGLLRTQLRADLGMLGLRRLEDMSRDLLFLRDFRSLPAS